MFIFLTYEKHASIFRTLTPILSPKFTKQLKCCLSCCFDVLSVLLFFVAVNNFTTYSAIGIRPLARIQLGDYQRYS
jgi:hypothetical protein